MCIIGYCTHLTALLRIMLCEEGFFGTDQFSKQLDTAYEDFRSFCRARKISCSQPPFTPRLATLSFYGDNVLYININCFLYLWYTLVVCLNKWNASLFFLSLGFGINQISLT